MGKQIGEYWVGRCGVVRLQSEPSPGRFTVELVADYRKGSGITCGGYVSCYGDDELKPITEPEFLILARAYEAQRLIKDAEKQIIAQRKVYDAHEAALRALQDVRDAVKDQPVKDGSP